MSSRVALLCLLLTCAQVAPASDWASFAAGSARADDPLLIEVLRESDLQARIEICSALGARADPFVGDVIEAVMTERRGSGRADAELLLRILLAPLDDRGQTADRRRARLAANRSAVDLLLASISEFQDPQLVATLVRIAPLMEAGTARVTLARVAAAIIQRLRDSDGRLQAPYAALTLDLLSSAAAVGGQDLLDPLLQIARLSRERTIVEEARRAARSVAGG